MQWKQIDNTVRVQKQGNYGDWKQEISDACHNQCVYCSIHEGPWGGIDHYHIDHFRPKSKFAHLVNTITNLYLACPICNRFKSDDWPNEPIDLTKVCYPDPADHDYSDLFETDTKTYIVSGKYASSTYLINRLYLNRPQLVYERREHSLQLKAQGLIDEASKNAKLASDMELLGSTLDAITNITNHLHLRRNIVPYKLVEIKKQEGVVKS